MPLILGANSLAGGYQVKNSARFNSGSSDDLSRTPSSAGNRQKFTYSVWLKRSNISGSNQSIFATNIDGNNRFSFRFEPDELHIFDLVSGSFAYQINTNALFRDVSAWYHIVIAFDTTQATDTNRVKIYVNGVQITSFASASYPTQNSNTPVNNTVLHRIGSDSSGDYLNGYLSEVYLIDGEQLTPSSFGETDEDTGIWKPKAYTGTFGTNGFYLDFEDSANLGNDMSGNNNDFTVNNLTSIDQTTDTPTNNFATLNPLNYTPSAITYTEGNLKSAYPATWISALSTIGVSAGKWYWEAKLVTGGTNLFYGIATENSTTNTTTPYTQTGVIALHMNGDKYVDTTYTSGGIGTMANGDILGVALDLNSGTKTVSFYKNGTLLTNGTINLTSNFNSVNIFTFFAGNSSSTSSSWEVNYGSPMYSSGSNTDGAGYGNFSYSVPSGYYALCTKNLADFG